MSDLPGYRFSAFVVSCRRRQVLRAGTPVPLIPRYFDLLVLLLRRRQTVVTRQEIFDAVWGDVFVSDGALTQAIRTLRRTLGDDSREPRFIRTVSRHGYSFIHPDVVEVADAPDTGVPAVAQSTAGEEDVDALIERLLGRAPGGATLDQRRDIAQRLHAQGTERAVGRILAVPGHAEALALLRDTRWDVPGAGGVPLWGAPEGWAAARLLLWWRTRDALRITGRRWVGAAGGAAVSGTVAGLAGGGLLAVAPGASARWTAIVVLAVLGAVAGFVGAAGVAAGMAAAEAVARSRRTAAIIGGGAFGGLAMGATIQALGALILADVFGVALQISGALEGFTIGGTIAAAYAWTTAGVGGGIAAPRGAHRRMAIGGCALGGAVAGLGLSLGGRLLVGGVLHRVAQAFQGSHLSLAPLGAWLGEPAFGPATQALVAAFEGALFGLGLAWGLTRRR